MGLRRRWRTWRLGRISHINGDLMELIIIKPDELRAHWPVIAPALDSVIAATSPDWIKEDVFHRIKSGEAVLHVVYGLGQYKCMFILTREVEEYSGNPSLHIWIAHNGGDAESYNFGLEQIKQAARHFGATRLTLESPRLGWAKRFRLVSATYEVPLA
ncbi:hypothetical protein [Stenotrophomonas sp. AB1(2024)]|uniref:hypothetical protein n=1 Tax=Stenotrophomonas sp. AB1(2024) TaxID=3132215 RepID=UPI0030AE28F9